MNVITKFAFAAGFLLSGSMLSACQLPDDNDSVASEETIQQKRQQTANKQSVTTKHTQVLETKEQDIIKNTGIRYDSQLWMTDGLKPIDVTDLVSIKAALGQIKSTDNQVLDYQSNPAKLYRVKNKEEPYLDLISSDHFIEFNWYFALPQNTDNERINSVNHAKKIHSLASQLLGVNGGELVKDMLAGKATQNTIIGGQKIEVAQCRLTRCVLVIKKTHS